MEFGIWENFLIHHFSHENIIRHEIPSSLICPPGQLLIYLVNRSVCCSSVNIHCRHVYFISREKKLMLWFYTASSCGVNWVTIYSNILSCAKLAQGESGRKNVTGEKGLFCTLTKIYLREDMVFCHTEKKLRHFMMGAFFHGEAVWILKVIKISNERAK